MSSGKIVAAFALGAVTVRLSPRRASPIVSRFERAGGEGLCRFSLSLMTRELAANLQLAFGETVARAFVTILDPCAVYAGATLERNGGRK